MSFELEFGYFTAWILIFARLAGMIGFNPLLSRRNVPATVRAAFVFVLTLVLAPTLGPLPTFTNPYVLAFSVFKELFAGLCCGYVFLIFYQMLFFAGDMMDMQFGLAMAKVFDPGTNIQMSSSGNFINFLFVMYFFVTDSHLLMIHIFAASFKVLPLGGVVITKEILGFALSIFISAFSLAIRLALPYVAAEMVLEISMGVLMKLIPQIHVFVINIQMKVMLGMALMLLFASPMSNFLNNYTNLILDEMQQALSILGKAAAG